MNRTTEATLRILSGTPVREVLSAFDSSDAQDPLAVSDFIGSRSEVDRALENWSLLNGIQLAPFPAFAKSPNRVWVGSVPKTVQEKYGKDFEGYFAEDQTANPNSLTMVIYESPEAARQFRLASERQLRPVIIDSVNIGCPFDVDLFVRNEAGKLIPPPTGTPNIRKNESRKSRYLPD